MKAPVADFVKNYAKKNITRFHMPGHKGRRILGCEGADITEICGADVLSSASGIIAESEETASRLFGTAHTFYSAQGSSAAIFAMLALVKKTAGGRPLILAARNVHKAFVNACALLDFDVEWIMPEKNGVLGCIFSAETLEGHILKCRPSAVYITSPDYLGCMQDIAALSEVCRRYEIPLLCDNAHGAYLKFLDEPMHPIELGADVCCDSAHKTLPVLTGGAYLHISKNAPEKFKDNARACLSLVSSTSPSYLILQSLDLCNSYLGGAFRRELAECVKCVREMKKFISEKGFCVLDGEPLKITVEASETGFSGYELAEIMRKERIEPEFSDKNYVVLMITPMNKKRDFKRLKKTFSNISPKGKTEASEKPPTLALAERKMSIREAVLSEAETVDIKNAQGRICAELSVSCPPAVPIAVSGEEITEDTVRLLKYYETDKIKVVKI